MAELAQTTTQTETVQQEQVAPQVAPQEQVAPEVPQEQAQEQVQEPRAKAEPPKGAMDDLFEEQPQEAKPEEIPESYEFIGEDGQPVSEEIGQDYSSMARELGLTQSNAQKFFNSTRKFLKNKIAKANEAWSAQIQNDVELGGDRMQTTRANVKAAIDKFGSPELRSIIRQTGLSNHPDLVRFFARVGASISQDSNFINGKGTQPQKTDPYAYMTNSPDLV